MDKNSVKPRYAFVDLLKAIAIFFVVFYHYKNLKTNILKAEDIFTYSNYFFKSIFSTCVPIFFFVNGILLFNKDLNLKKHIYKLLNIAILTVVWGIITLLILMPIKNEYMSLFEFIKSLWHWKMGWINHLWFMHAIVVLYIFFPLLKIAYDKEIIYLYFFLTIVFILTFGNVFLSNCFNVLEFVIGKNYLKGNFNFFNNFNAFKGIYGYSIVYFILGGLILKYKKQFMKKQWTYISVISIIICMISLSLYGVIITKSNNYLYDTVWNGYNTIPTLCMVIALFILSLRYNSNTKISLFINTIGKNSLGIYFIHRIWGTLFIKYFKELPYSHDIVTNTIFALFITLISLLSVLLLKKIPILKKLFAI